MTNRSYRVSSAPSMAVNFKKPRLRRVELRFDGPSVPPEVVNNGLRSHGGTRGSNKHPPGQFSYNKEPEFERQIHQELEKLIGQEFYENHGSPVWLDEVNREITHSGESPLFVNRLLAPGKFEQEHGVIKFERALLHTNTRRSSAPSSRAGDRKYYRPNRTHQYLSATELRDITDESVLKYGRPTRTTLLRARSRTNSAPVNAYDLRREMHRRAEDVKNNSIFYAAKDLFEREHTRISYRFYNIYANDGETMHSFLTGARYNRAHLLDSKGLSMYGVYMPRHNPQNCFITGNTRLKDHGEEIPSAPPDSPRSDTDMSTPGFQSSPTSSHPYYSRPTSSHPSSRPSSSKTLPRATGSRPQSKSTARSSGSRPRSAKEVPTSAQSHFSSPKTPGSAKRDPDSVEITTMIPDTLKGKGVYVTMKGQKMVDMVESRLPRVTGISVPKLRKSRDTFDEMQIVNQPPPTPIDLSMDSVDRSKYDRFSDYSNTSKETGHERVRLGVTFEHNPLERVPESPIGNDTDRGTEQSKENVSAREKIIENTQNTDISQTRETNGVAEETNDVLQLEPELVTIGGQMNGLHAEEHKEQQENVTKKTNDNFTIDSINITLPVPSPVEDSSGKDTSDVTHTPDGKELSEVNEDTVTFFITEEERQKKENDSDDDSASSVGTGGEEKDDSVPMIRVEVFETDRKTANGESEEISKRITADDFPFSEQAESNGNREGKLINGNVHQHSQNLN